MNKKITQLRWLAATIMLVAAMVMSSTAWAVNMITPSKPSGGGSAASPYQIGTAAELYWFAGLVNGDASVCNYDATSNPSGTQQNKAACAVLTANIVVNSGLVDCKTMLGSLEYDASGKVTNGSNFVAWTPIGSNFQNSYTGTFDGKGYTVSGLYFNDTNKEKVGLFGLVDSGGKISNVGVLDSYFQFRMQGGGICGLNYGEINNCTNDGTVIGNSTGSGAGGVCGMNYGTVKDCENTGSVSGTVSNIGGVCGAFYSGTIENCLNEGTVSGTGETSKSAYGGVCGHAYGGVIKLSSNTASVSGNNAVGGVCGYNQGATLEDCYNTGAVVGTALSSFGGVCGSNSSGYTIKNCYNTGAVSGKNNVGGVCGENSGIITNCYYISGTATGGINGEDATGSAESKSLTQFTSGEVAYLLNEGKTDGSQAWYQALSSEGYPNLNKDTENRTVYGAYKHGETSPTCSNSQNSLSMLHAHAYDSNATNEASGNHDMSCEQNEQNPYTWADNEDYSNATAKCNFICSVCNSKVSKDMTVTHNEEKTNEPAKCIEKGHNYYVASLTFNGTTYTEYYTQDVSALGHDDSGDVTFNSGNKIYEKYCNRDGCDEVVGYYATSDGSVEAIANPEGDGFTANDLTLQDATTYDNKAVFTATKFKYTRTFSNTNWTTWYVPFDLTLTSDICAKYDFSRINNVHQYDTDNDGTADKTVVESFRQMPGVTLKANYPYLVKPVSEGDKNMVLPLEGVQPALAETNYIDCQSVDFSYTFTGTYTELGEGGSGYYDPYTLWIDGTWQHFQSLDPMRHYLTVTPRNPFFASAASLRSIMLSVIGDEGTTGIVNMYSDERKAAETYDLGGRRLPAGASQRGVVIENGKVIIKK